MRPNQITQTIIGCAIEVHRHLGPGLLENAYEVALCRELDLQSISSQRQKRLPLHYKGIDLALSYRIDILVAETVVVEVFHDHREWVITHSRCNRGQCENAVTIVQEQRQVIVVFIGHDQVYIAVAVQIAAGQGMRERSHGHSRR